MDRGITRRNVIQGLGVIGAGMVLPGDLFGFEGSAPQAPAVYPPALTGMRGNHDGSFGAAHALGREGKSDWGEIQKFDEPTYDLVVIGGGLSGLSLAHFFRKDNPSARILTLDNHDDFGGHAKRNGFRVGDRTLIGYGGSSFLSEPSEYSEIVKGLLNDLGVDVSRFDSAFDQEFYKRHGLSSGLHFNKEQWGADRIVPFAGTFLQYLPTAKASLTAEESVARMPVSKAAQKQFLRLLTVEENPRRGPQARTHQENPYADIERISSLNVLSSTPRARVLDERDEPTPGLYATGNCTAGLLTTYPGPGATLGPAMTFSYIAGKELAAGSSVDLVESHSGSIST